MGNLKRISFITIFILMFLAPSLSFAKPIYVVTRPDGSILITSKTPPKGVNAKIYTGNPYYSKMGGGYSYSSTADILRAVRNAKLYSRYQNYIKKFANHYHISESLVKSVIHAESLYNPYAVSKKGALGLMQLMPFVAKEIGVRDPFDPQQNIAGGTKHLATLLRKYNGNRELAVAAYNAGAGAVDKYNGIPPYKETQDYVKKVLALQTRYETF